MKYTFILNLTHELNNYGKTFYVPITYKRRTIEKGKKFTGTAKKKFIINSVKYLKNILFNQNKKIISLTKDKEFITIILFYQNQEKYIQDSIKKIIGLDKKIELILINNNSNDNSINILESTIQNNSNSNVTIKHFFCSNINKIKYLQDLLKIVEYNNIISNNEFSSINFLKIIETYYNLEDEFVCLNVKKKISNNIFGFSNIYFENIDTFILPTVIFNNILTENSYNQFNQNLSVLTINYIKNLGFKTYNIEINCYPKI